MINVGRAMCRIISNNRKPNAFLSHFKLNCKSLNNAFLSFMDMPFANAIIQYSYKFNSSHRSIWLLAFGYWLLAFSPWLHSQFSIFLFFILHFSLFTFHSSFIIYNLLPSRVFCGASFII